MGWVQGGQLQEDRPARTRFMDARLAANDFQSFDDVCQMAQGAPEQGHVRFRLACRAR
jgi:hypothetical protein